MEEGDKTDRCTRSSIAQEDLHQEAMGTFDVEHDCSFYTIIVRKTNRAQFLFFLIDSVCMCVCRGMRVYVYVCLCRTEDRLRET